MLLTTFSALALQAAASGQDWHPYAIVPAGNVQTALSFDASRLERRGAAVLVWTAGLDHTGASPVLNLTRYRIDCAARTALAGEFIRNATLRPDERSEPLTEEEPVSLDRAPPTPQTRLAARLCNGAVPAEVGPQAWLNIPDAEGPGARFSYDTGVRRDGPRLQAWVTYAADGGDPTEARVELDCVARTHRTLERLTTNARLPLAPERPPTQAETRTAPAAAITSGTRESVLAFLLCPGGGNP